MNFYKIRERLLLGLHNVTLDNGENLNNILGESQIKDIANTLTHYIPVGNHENMISLYENLFKNIRGGNVLDRLHGTLETKNKTTKELKHDLFRVLFALYILGENVDEAITEMIAFYRSFTVNEIDLYEEEVDTTISTTLMKIDDTDYVRLNNETNKLVPTNKTNLKFKNLL